MADKPKDGSKTVVYAALVGNLLVAATKAVAAAMTGSSGMLSEAVHSFVDTGNEVLLLYGLYRSKQKPDADHPFGHGRELYFWSFIVAILVFAVGAGVSLYEGAVHLRNPEPIERPMVIYIVLGLSFVFESGSWIVAWREFSAIKGDGGSLAAIRDSKDPPKFMVLLEDSAALVGIAFAALGTWISVTFDRPEFDGYASLAIGVLLTFVAVVLARESKGLLIGERADPELVKEVKRIAAATAGVAAVNGLLTTHLAPDQIVAAMSLEFDDDLRVPDIERIVADVEARIRQAHPEIMSLFVKPQTQDAHRAGRERLRGIEAATETD